MTLSVNFERLEYFNFEINFRKNGNLFQQAEVPFLFESTKIENTTSNFYNVSLEIFFADILRNITMFQ